MIKLHVSKTRPRHGWIDRFADRLRELRPALSFVEASRLAVIEYAKGPDALPEMAAEMLAAAPPSLPAASPG